MRNSMFGKRRPTFRESISWSGAALPVIETKPIESPDALAERVDNVRSLADRLHVAKKLRDKQQAQVSASVVDPSLIG